MLVLILYVCFLACFNFIIEEKVKFPENKIIRFLINIIFLLTWIGVIVKIFGGYYVNLDAFKESIISLFPEKIKYIGFNLLHNKFIRLLLILFTYFPVISLTQKLWITSKKGEEVFYEIIGGVMLFLFIVSS